MIFKLFSNQQEELITMPETGMGYQLIQAKFKGEYNSKEFIVLNEELVVEDNFQARKYSSLVGLPKNERVLCWC